MNPSEDSREHWRGNDARIELLIQRVDLVYETQKLQAQQLTNINTSVGEMKLAYATDKVDLSARSQRNTDLIDALSKTVEHKDHNSIDRDKVMQDLWKEEESGRINADTEAEDENKENFKALLKRLDEQREILHDLKYSNRLLGFGATLLSTIAAGWVVGHLLHIFP